MLRFTLKMMIADLRSTFKGFSILFYLGFLGVITVLPFCTDNPLSFSYFIIIVLSYLTPQLPKLLYVLPLGSKTIRRYLHLRCLLSALLFISAGGIMTYISTFKPVPYLKQGWLLMLFYSQICLLMGLVYMKAGKKKNNIIITAIIVLLIGNLINSVFTTNFILHLRISLGFILASELLLLIGLKSIQLNNYTEVFVGYHQLFKNRNKAGGQTS